MNKVSSVFNSKYIMKRSQKSVYLEQMKTLTNINRMCLSSVNGEYQNVSPCLRVCYYVVLLPRYRANIKNLSLAAVVVTRHCFVWRHYRLNRADITHIGDIQPAVAVNETCLMNEQ